MPGVDLLVAVAKTVTVVCGGFVTLLAYRAYRRTRSRSLWALMLGIGLVTAGATLGGALHQFVGVGIGVGVGVQSAFTAVGFAVLAYSLYADGAPTR